jgi:hypothetical protein
MAKTAPRAKAEKPAAPKAGKEEPKVAKKAAAKAAPKQATKAAAAEAKPAAKAANTPAKTAKKAKAARKGKGDRLYCGVCGLVVSIDETCGCVDACDIICCGQEMQPRK